MILIGRGLDLKRFVRLQGGLSERKFWFLKSGSWSEPNFLCSFEGAEALRQDNISGDYSLRDPPVPIPNTEVKPQHADSTWLETAREGRSSPDSNKEHRNCGALFFLYFWVYNELKPSTKLCQIWLFGGETHEFGIV